MDSPDWIGQVLLAGGGATAILIGLFQFWGKNWIKHQLNKDLENAKAEISIHAAKRLRLQDKEYEVFPEIWARLSDSRASLADALMQFRTMPDLNRMSDDDFESWLKGIDLTDEEKQAMNSSTNRFSLFNKILDYKALQKAKENYSEFQIYFEKNRIFLSPEIRNKFDEIRGLLRQSWVAREVQLDENDRALLKEALDLYTKEVEPLMEELEEIVQRRLFPDQADTKQ